MSALWTGALREEGDYEPRQREFLFWTLTLGRNWEKERCPSTGGISWEGDGRVSILQREVGGCGSALIRHWEERLATTLGMSVVKGGGGGKKRVFSLEGFYV